MEESKKLEKEKNKVIKIIELIKEENKTKVTEIDDLKINIKEIKKECEIFEDKKRYWIKKKTNERTERTKNKKR